MKLRLKVVPTAEPDAEGIWITRKMPFHRHRPWYAPIKLKGVSYEVVASNGRPHRRRRP